MAEHGRSERRLSRRDRLLALVAPAILLFIAAIGVWNFHERRQSSWIGSSFGMFATYDNHATRAVRITVVDDGTETRVDARIRFPDLVDRSRAKPLGTAPQELAERVQQLTDADSVTVEVWTLGVDAGDDLAVVPHRIIAVSTP